MARGILPYLVVPLVALGVFGCKGVYDLAERDPWRNEEEQRCLASHPLKASAYLEPAAEIGQFGRGCGMTQPFKVSAIGDGLLSASRDETRPTSFADRMRSVLGTEPRPIAATPGLPGMPARPVAIEPKPTLACPLITAVDRWMLEDVQTAAAAWFGESVVSVRQLSAYSCRSMNGQRGARISEHAFGNALDVASFTLTSGREVTVKEGWRGRNDERGFLRQVFAGACERFSTVLGPGADAFHYDHFHLDLARRSSGSVCKPVPQELSTPQRERENLHVAQQPTEPQAGPYVIPAPTIARAPAPARSWPPSPAEVRNDPYAINARTPAPTPTRAPEPQPIAPAVVARPTPSATQDALFANRPLAQLPPAHLAPPGTPPSALPSAPPSQPPFLRAGPPPAAAPSVAPGEPLDLAPPRPAMVPAPSGPYAPTYAPPSPTRPGLRPPGAIPNANRFDPLVTGSVDTRDTRRFYKDAPAPKAKLPNAKPGED